MTLPPLPDAHGIAVLFLIVVALVLFTREKIPLETSSFAVLVLLIGGFELFPYESGGSRFEAIDFFQGFGHEALIAVCALMIAGEALVRTGALEPVARSLAALWKVSPLISLLLTLVVAGGLSALVNNVTVVVLLLPILASIAVRSGKSVSGRAAWASSICGCWRHGCCHRARPRWPICRRGFLWRISMSKRTAFPTEKPCPR